MCEKWGSDPGLVTQVFPSKPLRCYHYYRGELPAARCSERRREPAQPPGASESEGPPPWGARGSSERQSGAERSAATGAERDESGAVRCVLLGCAEAAVVIEHPQRGQLSLCPRHARYTAEIGGLIAREVGR